MLSFCRSILALLCVLGSLAASVQHATAKTHRLIFPQDRVCGTIVLGRNLPDADGFARYGGPLRKKGPARGVITVNDKSRIRLHIAPEQAGDLSFLDNLPVDVIGSLHIVGAKIGNREFARIVRMQVDYLLFANCVFNEDIEPNQHAPSEALRILCLSQDTASNLNAVLRWAKQCPRLQQIHGGYFKHLDSQQLELLAGKDSILTLEVDLEEGDGMLQQLSQFPRLRGLSIWELETEARTKLDSLKKLEQIKWLHWEYAVVGDELIQAISELPNLEELVLDEPISIEMDLSTLRGKLKHLKKLSIDGPVKKSPVSRDELDQIEILLLGK